MSTVKVTHVGESDAGGGAATAMMRLHDALLRLGTSSRALVHDRRSSLETVETSPTRDDADPRVAEARAAAMRRYVELNRTSISNTHFSLPLGGADVARLPVVADADVVHLHWIASYLTPSDVGSVFATKPVVWTLHDLAPLTGGCHYPVTCKEYLRDCATCPQLASDPFHVTATTLRDKIARWSGARPTFVAPSRFIADRARHSAVVQRSGASIVTIPHGIDVETFRPVSQAAARRTLGLPIDGTYVLCGSNFNAEKRKGFDLISEVMAAATTSRALDTTGLSLLTVGEPGLERDDARSFGIVPLGRVDGTSMPTIFAAADVFVHPSLEDNAPLMLLEAASCGVPVIAFDVGGVSEIVRNGVSGLLVPAGDTRAMATALTSLLGDRQRRRRLGESARAIVEERFDDRRSARRHAELYAELAVGAVPFRSSGRRSPASELDAVMARVTATSLAEEASLAREPAIAVAPRSPEPDPTHLAEQLSGKEAELIAVYRVARERERLLATQNDAIEEQRHEMDMLRRIAEERRQLVDRVDEVAAGYARTIAEQQTLIVELQTHSSSASDLAARREAALESQSRENAELRDVAAERLALIERLHAAAEELFRHLAERDTSIVDLRRVADEREGLARTLHAELQRRDELVAGRNRRPRAWIRAVLRAVWH